MALREFGLHKYLPLPHVFMILDGAIKTIHPSLEEASYTLRANRYQTFFHVFMPLLKPALANAFLIVIVQSLADFSNHWC